MRKSFSQLLPRVRQRVALAPYTTFRIGGPAAYFFIARTRQALISAVTAARKAQIPFFILAGGSNLLISNRGFDGLIILVRAASYETRGMTIRADAGVPMKTLVRESAKSGLAGLEWAGGLPGTLGGAVRGNAGAFEGEIEDSVYTVEFVDSAGKIRTLSRRQCQFSYRSSIFKKRGWTILSATLTFKRGSVKEIQSVAKAHMQYRASRHPLAFPNAGSVFKNVPCSSMPENHKIAFSKFIKKDPFPVVPTACLIAEAGLKGKRVGGAQVSEKHTNFIVNRGNATSDDVLSLIKKVKETLEKKFSVHVEEEIQYLS